MFPFMWKEQKSWNDWQSSVNNPGLMDSVAGTSHETSMMRLNDPPPLAQSWIDGCRKDAEAMNSVLDATHSANVPSYTSSKPHEMPEPSPLRSLATSSHYNWRTGEFDIFD